MVLVLLPEKADGQAETVLVLVLVLDSDGSRGYNREAVPCQPRLDGLTALSAAA